ncbi:MULTISPECIES: glycosyltransferase family 4 protein [unclassified Salinibacterium]|uniref:glycosyltransferase family 4 protein n=1 Tax=unclassified Salinibacterium TaxID=2632331 RepID=UPI00143DE31D|nr:MULTISPECIES: glycosyltransferase family 4 protein [unclassified Salinibacterium]
MRVLVFSHSSAVDNLGGAERSLLEFLDAWRAVDPELEVFVVSRTPSGHLQPELDRRGIPWMNLRFHSVVRHRKATTDEHIYRSARDDFAAVRALEQFISGFEPDLVITNTIVAPWAALAAKLSGVPHVWFPREYGDGHEFQIPAEDVFEDIGTLSDLVVTNSRSLRDFLSEWVEAEKLAVLYPRIDIAEGNPPNPQWPFPESAAERPLRLVCVGRIAKSKGQARAVRAVAGLKLLDVHVELVLVGSAADEDRRELETLVEASGVGDRVRLTGELEDPRPVVMAADLGLVVSDSEGFGRVTVEFMAAGKPVIGTATGATVELVDDGVTGALFDPKDSDSLARAIRRYADEPGLAARHGEAAWRTLRDDIASRHTLPPLLARFADVTAAGSAPLPGLPRIMAYWMSLPTTAVNLLTATGGMVDPRTSLTWKVGRMAMAGPRTLLRLLRKGSGQA